MYRKVLAILILAVSLSAACVLLADDDGSAENETYFMDNGIRYVVTDETEKKVSVAPLEGDAKYAADTKLVIPETATDGTVTYTVTGISAKTFAFATSLYGIELPDTIETFGDQAFRWCAVYQDLVLPASLKTIGQGCFDSAVITGLDMSKCQVTVIPDTGFYNCKYLKWVKFNDKVTTIERMAFNADVMLDTIDFNGSPIQTIGEKAFGKLSSGTEFTVPATVTSIDDSQFYLAYLTSINVAEGNTHYKSVDGALMTADGEKLIAYPSLSEQTSFKIPAGTVTVAKHQFCNCPNLSWITVDNSVVFDIVAKETLKDCPNLYQITVTQTSALPDEYAGILGTYFIDGKWAIQNASFRHLTIDSEQAVDLSTVNGVHGEYIDFTERSVNTTGGVFLKDGSEVTSAERAGHRFSSASEDPSEIFSFDNTRFVTVKLDPEEGGTVTGTGSIEIGRTATLTATANSGYLFGYWNDDPTQTDPTYSFVVEKDTEVKATFVIWENCFFTVDADADFEMTHNTGTAPENAKASSYNYYAFEHVDSHRIIDNGDGTITYVYILKNGTYGAIAKGDGMVTYKDLFTKEANVEYDRTITSEMLHPEGKDSHTVDRSLSNDVGDDIGGMLLSANRQNHLQMEVGEVTRLMVYRQWQAIGNWMYNPFLEPDIHYEIRDLDNNPVDDVLEIDVGGQGDVTYKLKALKEGTVVVTFRMDAFTLNVVKDTFYGATWPEMTEVLMVTVGDKAAFDTGMTIYDPDLKKEKLRQIDCEVDIFYYDHNTPGYDFTFEPAAGTTVEVYNPVLGTVGITKFVKGTTTPGTDGKFTVRLTEGKNIVKMTNGGEVRYQVLTAYPVVILVDGVDLKDAVVFKGVESKIVFKNVHADMGGIYNSKGKLAGIYNSGATIYYEYPDGSRVKTANQPQYGHYFFVSQMQYQTLTVKVPVDWTSDTMEISPKGVKLSGVDGAGDHRTWYLRNQVGLGELRVGFLPEITLNVIDVIVFEDDTGTHSDTSGTQTFNSLEEALDSDLDLLIQIIGTTHSNGNIELKKDITVFIGGSLQPQGSVTVPKGATLTVRPEGELVMGTDLISNSGTVNIQGTAVTRGNVDGDGTFKGSFTVLPYFEVGDTFTFSSGSGTTVHGEQYDSSSYNENSKVTMTFTVTKVPSKIDGGWEDCGEATLSGISFSSASDLVYVLSYSVGKVTVIDQIYRSQYRITAIDQSVIDAISAKKIGIVLPSALRDVQFGPSVTKVTEGQYTDTKGSVVHYSVDETSAQYMNGYGGYGEYAYATVHPDYRYCEQGTVTKVDYAPGQTTYDTKLSKWAANDLVCCDGWVCGDWADMLGTVITRTITFAGENVTFSQPALKAGTNAKITVDGDRLYVNAVYVTAVPAEGMEILGWSVESGTVVKDDMTVTVTAGKMCTVTVRAGDRGTVDGQGSMLFPTGTTVTVSGNVLTIGDTVFTAVPGHSTDTEQVTFSKWVITPAGNVTDGMTAVAVFAVTFVPPADESGRVNVDVSDQGDAEISVALPSGISSVQVKYGTSLAVYVPDAQDLAGKTVTTSLGTVENPSQKEGTAYEFVFQVDGASYGGVMDVTVKQPYQPGKKAVVYFYDDGKLVSMPIKSSFGEEITFETDHNSVYIVCFEDVKTPVNWSNVAIVALVVIFAIAAVITYFAGAQRRL